MRRTVAFIVARTSTAPVSMREIALPRKLCMRHVRPVGATVCKILRSSTGWIQWLSMAFPLCTLNMACSEMLVDTEYGNVLRTCTSNMFIVQVAQCSGVAAGNVAVNVECLRRRLLRRRAERTSLSTVAWGFCG